MKAFRYTLILLLLLQITLPSLIPLKAVYHNRIDYNLTLDNIDDIDVVLDKLKTEIKRKHLKDYIILLGDSVLYGSPGNSDQAVNAYMQAYTKQTIINLAYPGSQTGDVYTMLLKLDKLGISTDQLITSVRYASFVPREPDPAVVFWFADDLRKLAPSVFQHVLPNLRNNGYKLPASYYAKFKFELYQNFLPATMPYAYKDFLYKMLKNEAYKWSGEPVPDDSIGDNRPWTEKGDLQQEVHSTIMQRNFTDRPLDMTPSSLDIYFMDLIIQHQQGKKTLYSMTGTNHTLTKEYEEKPGYQVNLQAIDHYFQQQHVNYVNLEGMIPDSLFADHSHLISAGYKQLAQILWQFYNK